MKHVGVLGSSGMLGADLVTYLSPQFSLTEINKSNYSTHIGKQFDVLINANGNSKRFWANKNIVEDFTLSTVSVYKSIFDFKYLLYVYISSSDVYENHTSPRYTKEKREINFQQLLPYGFHKYLSEQIVKKNTNSYLILRCSMMLGQHPKKGPLYDIFHDRTLFISKNSELQMITTKEVARVIMHLLKKREKNMTLNLGGKRTVSFKNISKILSKPVIFSEDSEEQIYEMNIQKLNRIFPLRFSMEYLQEYLSLLKL